MKTKTPTYKYLSTICQILTIAGAAAGLGALCYMVWELTDLFMLVWELTDLFMLEGHPFSKTPDMQLSALLEVVDDVQDDVIEPAIFGGVSLGMSILTGLAGLIFTCLTNRNRTESV